MVFTYLPGYESIPHSPCPLHTQHPSTNVNWEDPLPYAPEVQTVPLPLSTTLTTSLPHFEDGMFPLSILRGLPTNHPIVDVLRSIALTTPVHIHTPDAHIGTVVHESHGAPGQKTNALKLMYFLQAFLWQPMNLQMSNYTAVPETMKTQVEMAFHRRTGYSLYLTEDKLEDQRSLVPQLRGSLVGYDLLLGNDEVWGFESVSFEGYSVVHLARNIFRI